MKSKKPTIYFDYASATPMDARVLRVLTETSKRFFANPSALHKLGVETKEILENARAAVARGIGAHADEIVFVSGGTESDNLAIMGVVRSFKQKYPTVRPHVLLSAIEHAAVKATGEYLQNEGVAVSIIPVNQNGLVNPKDVRKLIRPETVLVSVMLVNNEIGTIQSIQEIAKEVRHARRHKEKDSLINVTYPLFHSDASQALNYLDISVEKLGVDLLTINGSKIYGPKGVGALFVKRRTPIEQILFGGDQEFGLRPGTESVPTIAAFAHAVTLANTLRDSEVVRLSKLQTYTINKLRALPYNIRINGDLAKRVPNNINFTIPAYNGETLVIYLDAHGLCLSVKSACKSDDPETSYVIAALGYDDVASDTGSVRMSFGRGTTKKEIDYFLKALVDTLKLLTVR